MLWDNACAPGAHVFDVERIGSPLDEEESLQAPSRAEGVLADPVRDPRLGRAPAQENDVVGRRAVRLVN